LFEWSKAGELSIGETVEGRCLDLIKETISEFPWRDKRKSQKLLEWSMSLMKFKRTPLQYKTETPPYESTCSVYKFGFEKSVRNPKYTSARTYNAITKEVKTTAIVIPHSLDLIPKRYHFV
jgi:hypothetical protein